MIAFSREAPSASKGRVISIAQPFSFFEFREKHFGDKDGRFSEFSPLARILSQVRSLNASSMLIEDIAPDSSLDLIQETEDLKIRLGAGIETEVMRLTFLSAKTSRVKTKLDDLEDDEFLGYAVVREDFLSGKLIARRILESVVMGSRFENNFIRGAPRWKCRASGRTYKIYGYLYAQQNGITNVCAHVALRTLASVYHPDGDMSYREINKLLGIDHKKNWVGVDLQDPSQSRGLTIQHMLNVLDQCGARCINADYSPKLKSPGKKDYLRIPYQRYLYGSVESGYPAAMIFDTAESDSKHVIPVFGHTFNQDLWVSNAERSYFQIGKSTRFLPSDSWLSSFVVHDDNWGSNFCCPKHFLKPLPPVADPKAGKKPDIGRVENSEWLAHVIATLPKSVKLNPLQAEAIGLDFLSAIMPHLPEDDNKWGSRLIEYQQEGLVVYRPILITGQQYCEHLSKLTGWSSSGVMPRWLRDAIRSSLKGTYYWMVEMSVPELFSANLRKVGEVILRSDLAPKPTRDFESFTLARLPGQLVVCKDTDPVNPDFEFIPSGISSHVQLFGCEEIEK